MADELKTIKFQMMLSPSEAEAIDDWGFKRRIRSRAEAIRRLVQIGMEFDEQAPQLERHMERALKVMGLTLEKLRTEAIDGENPLSRKAGGAIAMGMKEFADGYEAAMKAVSMRSLMRVRGNQDTQHLLEIREWVREYQKEKKP